MELTFNTVPDPILLLDEEFRVKRANRAAALFLGLDPAQLMGKPCYEVVHGSSKPHTDCPYRAMLANGEEHQADIVDEKLGKILDTTASPLRNSEGNVCGCVHVLRDVTGRKQAEESLRLLSVQLLRAQDDERRQIARDLHDSAGQQLAAVAMNLAWMEESADTLDPRTRGVISETLDLANQCLKEIRNFSYLLHPPGLDESGLVSALQWYVEGFSRRSGVQVELELPPSLHRLPSHAEIALFRIVQEALTNVHRHSGSPKVKIRIVQDADRLLLEVEDEGRGMPALAKEGFLKGSGIGVGISGMRERMRELGGELEVRSTERGTSVRASMPLKAN